MIARAVAGSAMLSLALMSGCAATIPTELAKARAAYAAAAASQTAALVPAELYKAQLALQRAETEFEDHPRGYHVRDLSYVAERRAELADALAAGSVERTAEGAANVAYQSTQDDIMRDTRQRLGASETDLAVSRATEAATAARLSSADAARAAADVRTSDAQLALARVAAVKEESRGLVVTLAAASLFDVGGVVLLTDSRGLLTSVADSLLERRDREVLVEAHTDSSGTDADNVVLSQRRADAVRTFLVGRGYEVSRIRSVGLGESHPIADNGTAEGRASNRRVEIIVAPARQTEP